MRCARVGIKPSYRGCDIGDYRAIIRFVITENKGYNTFVVNRWCNMRYYLKVSSYVNTVILQLCCHNVEGNAMGFNGSMPVKYCHCCGKNVIYRNNMGFVKM